MTTFLLIRHATGDHIGRHIAGRTPGVHLNQEGQQQAQRLIERLSDVPIRFVYSSPLERARETAAPLVEQLNLEIITSAAFNEIDFGEWTNRSLEELDKLPLWQKFNAQRSTTRPPGGELMLEVQTRVVTELTRLRELHHNSIVAIFSHGDVIRMTLAHYLGVQIDFFSRFEISPASISILALRDYGAKVLCMNVLETIADITEFR